MSDYQRMIVYIYMYNEGKKAANSGFAKVEKRNNRVRVNLSIKGVRSDNSHDVYLVLNKDGKLKKIKWGTLARKGIQGEFKSVTWSENMLGEGIDFENCCGFLISGDATHAGFWKDISSGINEIEEYTDGKNLQEMLIAQEIEEPSLEKEEAIELDVVEAEVIEETVSQEVNNNKSVENENIEKADIESENIKEKEVETESVEDFNIKTQSATAVVEEETSVGVEEVEACGECRKKERIEESNFTQPRIKKAMYGKNWWINLCGCREEVGGLESITAIRIDIKDIKYLPKSCWIFGRNSFVLHEYYNFRFIIVARHNDGTYYIGVPGRNDERERAVAEMFGFNDFIRQSSMNNFGGYWLKAIDKD